MIIKIIIFNSLGNHNWDCEPFIVDLSGDASDITSAVKIDIVNRFRLIRSQKVHNDNSQAMGSLNAPMYIVSSCDKLIDFMPSLSSKSPEKVVLGIIVSAAQVSAKKLLNWIASFTVDSNDSQLEDIMSSETVLNNCNVIFKFHKASLNTNQAKGPLMARLNVYANLSSNDYSVNSLLVR